jgi:hypothetical protein
MDLGIPSRPHDPNGIVFFGSIGAMGVGVPPVGLDGQKVEFGVVRVDFTWEKSPSIRIYAEDWEMIKVEEPQQEGGRGHAVARSIKRCGRRPCGGDLLLSDHLQLVKVG